MALTVQLLGPPAVRFGDSLGPAPRDRKTWGVLAYLMLSETAPSRRRLAELLFPDVDDPLAAVRWSLASIRRLVPQGLSLDGDPVVLRCGPDLTVDVDLLLRGRWSEAAGIATLDGDLLEGLAFGALPAFDLWLASERMRLHSAAAAVLHEATLATLARDPVRAVEYGQRLVARAPLDEGNHVVLVRALMAAGKQAEAALQVEACQALFESELQVRPTGALRDALAESPRESAWIATGASVRALLDTADSAIAAGSWSEGFYLFRRAVADSRRLDQPHLLARALVGLGSALVHAARGYDEEGAASLHEGGELAEAIGESLLAATSWRELAWIEFLRARYDRAWLWLTRASANARNDPQERAWIELTSGSIHTDSGNYGAGLMHLTAAIEAADSANLAFPAALARSFLGRLHLLRGELDEATVVLERAIQQARDAARTSLVPWPEALLAEVALRRGNVDAASDMFEHAFAIGRQIGDPCWESMGARGVGMVTALRGDVDSAVTILADSARYCRRLPDSYLWVEAYGIEALCATAIEHSLPSAAAWVDELARLAAVGGFRELSVRALIHRSRLGDPGALSAARAAGEGIDNPMLQAELAAESHR